MDLKPKGGGEGLIWEKAGPLYYILCTFIRCPFSIYMLSSFIGQKQSISYHELYYMHGNM